MTPEQFARRMRKIARDFEPSVGGLVNETAGVILATVIPATPVDTGRARGNWQVNVGSPITADIDRLDTTGQATLAQGQAEIATCRKGQSIYITNNLSYIGRLNEGYSAQAPAGFVELDRKSVV